MLDIIYKYFDDFSADQQLKLGKLDTIYREWNEKINVVSRKDIDQLYLHHVLHSLSIAVLCGFAEGAKVLDIGCGGGFPGVPLAIFYPDVQFLLVDSIAKKLKVVEAVVQELDIKNITILNGRVEEIKGQKFDFALSRGVAPLKDLWAWSKPLLQKGRKSEIPNGLVCLKGGDLHQEISDSGVRPKLIPVYDIFKEDYFKEKYLVHVGKT